MINFAIRKGPYATPPKGYVRIFADGNARLVQVESDGTVTPLTGAAQVSMKVNWNDIEGKPTQYPMAPHGHASSEISGYSGGGGGSSAWADITGKPATFPPDPHGHDISGVTGLQSALDGKQPAGSYLTAVSWGDVSGKPSTFDPSSHAHAIADVTGLQTALDALGGGGDPWTWTKLALNSTVSTTTFANVTGMTFTATALTTYIVDLFGAYQSAATTTGIGLALDVPTGATVIGMNIVSTSAAAVGGTEQIADATTTGATTGVRSANTNTPIMARWIVSIGATGGTVQLMQRSEIAGSNTVLQAGITALGRRSI